MAYPFQAVAWRFWAALIGGFVACAASSTCAFGDQFYASVVTNYAPGTGVSRGFTNTALALGAPHGAGDTTGSYDVLNLGVGGSATFGFDSGGTSRSITNGTGADFIVFENPFYANGDITASFAELMFVQVSSDGQHFAQFPTLSKTPGPVDAYGTLDPAGVSGFGGVHPVYANPDSNSTSPFDPATAGGDAFDLSALDNDALVLAGQVDLNDIRYIRLVDVLGDGSVLDSYGNAIYDATGSGNNGADVDAISVINGLSVTPEPSAGIILLLVGALLVRPQRGRHGFIRS